MASNTGVQIMYRHQKQQQKNVEANNLSGTIRQSQGNPSGDHHPHPSGQKSQSSASGQGRVPSSLRENGMNIIGGQTSSAQKNFMESRIPSGGPVAQMGPANRNSNAVQASTAQLDSAPQQRRAGASLNHQQSSAS